MTVGEKIQKYRKEMGLSQEELGQKLYVSRQTVSLWEMDKTLPTVDNLIRLKEIFGVSLDDILLEEDKDTKESCDNKAPDTEGKVPESIPSESYRFEFSSGEIKETVFINVKNLLSRAIFHILLIVAMFLVCLGVEDSTYSLAIAATSVIAIRYIIAIRQFLIIRKRTYQRMGNQIYEYSIFENYFEANIMNKAGETLYRRKCFFEQISKVFEAKNYFLISIDGARDECFVLRKSDLKDNSLIYAFQRKYPAKVKALPFQDVLRTVYYVGAVFTGVALVVTADLLLTSYPFDIYRGKLWWLYFLFALFPIFCTVIGILQKRRKESGFLRIIIPLVLALFLILIGSMASFFGYPNSKFEEELETILAEKYESPNLLHVFRLEKDGESVDNICIFETKSHGLVVGTFYYYRDEMQFDDYGENIRKDVDFGFLATTSDFFVHYMLCDDKSELPSDYYECKEVTVDGETKYICFHSIEIFER